MTASAAPHAAGFNADVAIVGGGPVGALIANLLGTYGLRTVVIERSPQILDYPRAVGMDDEALRVLQAAGLAQEVLKDTISNVPMRMFTATGRCFADILPTTREFGWYRRNIFSQPLAERALRQGLARFPHVHMRLGTEVTGFAQDPAGVTLAVRSTEPPGANAANAANCGDAPAPQQLRVRYLVGADGGRSTVREQVLKMPFDGATHARKWVVIECDNDPLDAPFTALHCVPARPYVTLRLPYGLRRWEFILFPGEDDEQMLRPEKVRELLRGHVPDPSALNILRARVYTHHSRVARRFREGRVFLAGDAAHLSPPWIGQGLNAGIRDAGNLAWKLAAVVRDDLGPQLLDTYHAERHGHAKAMIDLADQVGAIFALRNRPLAWLRDRLLLGMQHLPPVRDYVLQMRFKPMPRYGPGAMVSTSAAPSGAPALAPLGRMLLQPQVELPDGRAVMLDDACGQGFALLGWQCDPLAHFNAAQRARWQALGARALMVVRARSGAAPGQPITAGTATTVVQDLENVLSVWFQRSGATLLLLRPDRYVAALGTAQNFAAQCDDLLVRFGPPAERQDNTAPSTDARDGTAIPSLQPA